MPNGNNGVSDETVSVTMTSFAVFCASDAMGQLAKIREIRRQYEQDYRPSPDFWSRFRQGVEKIHRAGGGKDGLQKLVLEARDNRGEQYASAVKGYAKAWGRKRIEFVADLNPTIWTYDRLRVRVNPEWLLRIDGHLTVVKLHLRDRLPLNQRIANPLLHLLSLHPGATGRAVAIVDVHRGNMYRPTTHRHSLDSVLQMQAAAFLVGWDACGTSEVA